MHGADALPGDGVCGCGAVLQYTITYDGGDSEGSIPAGTKTHGENFTLSSDTFTREGYVQTGWMDDYGNEYDLGGTYTLDEDMTFYPIWYKVLTVPFITTVELGGDDEPGETTFDLALGGGAEDFKDVTVSGSVTTNGAGEYDGTLTITGPEGQLWGMLGNGVFVQQVDAGVEGWTVDDTVYGLYLWEIAAYSTADNAGFAVVIFPAVSDGAGNYTIDEEAEALERMSFTNIYTKSAAKPSENTPGTDKTATPQTGDNSHMALWIALLFVSGGLITVTGVYSKKKRSAK